MNHQDLPDAGRTSHAEIDAQLPTPEEKRALAKIAPAIANFSASGIRTILSTDDTANPPTDAQLDTAFGTPATVGEGFVGLVDDSGAGNNVYLCLSDGTHWWYAVLTKAV